MKHIGADRLKAEIKRLQQQNDTSEDKDYPQYELDVACGYDMACDKILKLIDSLQQEQPRFADASKTKQPGAPVDGEVHHVLNCHYLSTDNTQLCERLREFPEGAKVDIFIFAKEDK